MGVLIFFFSSFLLFHQLIFSYSLYSIIKREKKDIGIFGKTKDTFSAPPDTRLSLIFFTYLVDGFTYLVDVVLWLLSRYKQN